MHRGSDAVLLSAAIILAAVTAALSIEPVRRDMNDYFTSESSPTWEKTAQVVRANVSEDPSRGSTPIDWRVALSGD
jgi:hypothetical protein